MIHSSSVLLQFKNGGETIPFRVDAENLLWAKAISSVWPSQELFNIIKSGDYDLQIHPRSSRWQRQNLPVCEVIN